MKDEKKMNPSGFSGFLWGLIVGLLIMVIAEITILATAPEIRFAINKHNIVKSVRIDYEKRQKELEESYVKRDKTPEEKLIEEITNQIKK
jgi:hypothetical protein